MEKDKMFNRGDVMEIILMTGRTFKGKVSFEDNNFVSIKESGSSNEWYLKKESIVAFMCCKKEIPAKIFDMP